MKRYVTETKIGETQIRYRIRIEDEESANIEEMRFRQHAFLMQLVDSFELLSCGPCRFQTLKVSHNGQRWIVEAEATQDVTCA